MSLSDDKKSQDQKSEHNRTLATQPYLCFMYFLSTARHSTAVEALSSRTARATGNTSSSSYIVHSARVGLHPFRPTVLRAT
mmetsp:Transcript_3548/g.5504  ORF Transcript_3548/g.5504 Transcript_3548/m.5504 type:complete len:81 (+) Transcript_3548:129-371(+)